ncbi:hypothetical protein GOP47_0014804 [Adiantum capillus-veneris]|uniref:Uncharacterized protein n=1 Tax=Adiantum capillus-veneris TaxID=13818 RepID=A0A9D4UMA0_ADICA|nr:hypothetical protein GOP47_0014804 [Adiantum capillus-veneris]
MFHNLCAAQIRARGGAPWCGQYLAGVLTDLGWFLLLRHLSLLREDMGNMELACPRPLHPTMRMGSGDIQTCKPFRKLTSCASLPAEGEPGLEILEILLDKARLWDDGGSPISFGSPPVRASNPLIHDATQHTRNRHLAAHHMGRNPLCASRVLPQNSLMLGEYLLLPRNCSHMGGTAINAAFIDTSKLRAHKQRVLSQEALLVWHFF